MSRLVTTARLPSFPKDRTCTVAGCDTVLSVYNSTDRCASHKDRR